MMAPVAPRAVLVAVAAVLVAVGAVGASPERAAAHSAFVGAQPHPGARLEQAPARIVLTFTEPLNRRLARAELVGADGRAVALSAQAADARRLLLKPRGALPTGSYRVLWHTVSTDDGHALEGSFAFGVRVAAAGGTQKLEESPLARSGVVRVGLRGVLYCALILLAGALLVPRLVRGKHGSWLAVDADARGASAVARRERRIIENTAWCAVLAAAATTLAETADAAGGLGLGTLDDYLTTSGSGVARIVLVASLAVVALAATARPRASAGAAVVALGAVAFSGHAGSASPRAATVANDWVHLLSGSVWLGGMAMLVLVWGPTLRRGASATRDAVARDVVPGFGRVALPAFLLVVVTGLVNLVVQLGHLDALWRTGYGQVLLAKMALVGLIAAFSATHALRLRPKLLGASASPRDVRRHWALLRSEPAVGVLVLAVVGLLVAFPLPPRQLGDADEAVAAQPVCDPCPLPAPAPDELAVADHAGPLLVAGWLRRRHGETTGTIRVYDRTGRATRAEVNVLGGSGRACGPACWRFAAPAGDGLGVAVRTRGGRWTTVLPSRWDPAGADRGRRVLERAQATMRRLRSARQVEDVTSGPGTLARTSYRLRAPDRFAFATGRGVQTVVIGTQQWVRTAASPWQRTSFGSGIGFSLRQWFRWTVFATHVRVLGSRAVGASRRTELALMDPATPAWVRLSIDERTGRVLQERMITQQHFTRSRFEHFDRPERIDAPHVR